MRVTLSGNVRGKGAMASSSGKDAVSSSKSGSRETEKM